MTNASIVAEQLILNAMTLTKTDIQSATTAGSKKKGMTSKDGFEECFSMLCELYGLVKNHK